MFRHSSRARTAASAALAAAALSACVVGAADSDVATADGTLDPDLAAALQEAASDLADHGITLQITSGWRSSSHQERLFEDAVTTYGSTTEAQRWVARPGTSSHETGDAVDVAPRSAARWLAEHGASYGLCRVYDNEPWHFERRSDAITEGCPPTYADPSQDPRTVR
ncbi:M15 family metallopeptidase [Mumia quercus]|uniref:M15 family metallopeptidase n=1 Tax=Mumia quercus TaxID=2976125 RepID=UPI0021D1BF03|nr:M15 family metallopeptidase [Mumia quercus]